jgi:hypothetical protein
MSILVAKKYTKLVIDFRTMGGNLGGGGGSLCVYFFKVACVKDGIVWGVLCEGTLKTLILLSFKISIFTYLNHVKLN